MTLSERADELEERMLSELETQVPTKSALYTSGDIDPVLGETHPRLAPGQRLIMADDPRLARMPSRPTLLDFFRLRFRRGAVNHLLQSAKLALENGHGEKVVTACLLHDIAIAGFIQADHGYWGAQLLEPYVDEEISWAIRAHQALRFYPDASVGYTYPESYVRDFGLDFTPEPYVEAAYREALRHPWYMTGRLITINDLYAFDPNVEVSLDPFIDILGRNFRQPEEGLGFDSSPVAHMWRTMIWPTRFL